MATNIKGTANIIAKLMDNQATLLFVDKTHQIDPYRVQNLEKLEYDGVNHAWICTFGGTDFSVPLADYDIYFLSQ